MTDLYADCTEDCERMPECAVCHAQKKPIGRSAPMNSYYCGEGCRGYRKDPKPGHLWKGELAEIRGEPHDD